MVNRQQERGEKLLERLAGNRKQTNGEDNGRVKDVIKSERRMRLRDRKSNRNDTMLRNSPDMNDWYNLYGGTGRGSRMGYYGNGVCTEGHGGYGGCHGQNPRNAGRGQGHGTGAMAGNQRYCAEAEEENMVTLDKNAGIKWGYGFDRAEWRMAGNDKVIITKEKTSETGNEEQVKGK